MHRIETLQTMSAIERRELMTRYTEILESRSKQREEPAME